MKMNSRKADKKVIDSVDSPGLYERRNTRLAEEGGHRLAVVELQWFVGHLEAEKTRVKSHEGDIMLYRGCSPIVHSPVS